MTPDTLAEIWETMSRHKLRTALTMLSVGWGVLVLIVLLGAGRGLERGATGTFRRDALNAVWIDAGTTSEPFAGRGPGRKIRFDTGDYETLRSLGRSVEYASGVVNLKGVGQVKVGTKHAPFDVRGVYAEHQFLELSFAEKGRFLSQVDIEERRKVAVLGREVATFFFGQKDPIGEWVEMGNASYRVIGVYADRAGAEEERTVYVPVTTLLLANGSSRELANLGLTVAGDLAAGQVLVGHIRELLGNRYEFSPSDKRAVRIWNNLDFATKVQNIFRWISAFIWVVGIGTLLAGVVGVSNLMLISVRERIKEIGIRKALGATPGAIVSLIVQEAVLITAAAGYLGLVAGLGLIDLGARFVPDKGFMGIPEVDLKVAIAATVLIVISGVVAGYFPARLAARVHPIEALRAD